VLLAVSGAGRSFLDVTAVTLLERSLPDDQLGAALGLQESLLMAGKALGAFLAPLLVHGFGSRGAFVAAGLIVPTLAAMAWTRPRNLDQHATVPRTYALLARIPMFASSPNASSNASLVISSPRRQAQAQPSSSRDTAAMPSMSSNPAMSSNPDGCRSPKAPTESCVFSARAWFGEIALLRDIPRTSTVTALTDVTLQSFGRTSFLNALTGSPLATHTADQYARRYQDLGRARLRVHSNPMANHLQRCGVERRAMAPGPTTPAAEF
jgi:CRP-like cAMP-binding protein